MDNRRPALEILAAACKHDQKIDIWEIAVRPDNLLDSDELVVVFSRIKEVSCNALMTMPYKTMACEHLESQVVPGRVVLCLNAQRSDVLHEVVLGGLFTHGLDLSCELS